MAELKQVIKELDFHQNFVGSMFLKPPEDNFSRVNIFGEISSLTGFQERNLYLFYEFALPYGWKIDDENEYYQMYKEHGMEEERVNQLKSVSQISKSYVNPHAFSFVNPKENTFHYVNNPQTENENLIKDQFSYIHSLSLPFEIELLGHNDAIGVFSPKLLIQVNSVDSWNRHRIEGYCFLNVPIRSGFNSYDVQCYKPKEDIYLKIFSFFLGGSRKIPELQELAKSSSEGENNVNAVLNRYGIMTEYTGNVHINLNCVVQNKDIMNNSRKLIKARQGVQDYNLLFGIDKAIGNNKTNIKDIANQRQMNTTEHGLINAYGS